MTKALYVIATAAILGLGAQPSLAQTRVFVAGSGSDTNPCSLAAPCRSFQHAHDTVVAGGEIVALDAAGYGTLNITKAVTVTAIGIEASVTSSSTNPAITIGAGASDVVTLRGLTLFGGAISGDGIDVNSARSVTIRDCSLSGFSGVGILVEPSSTMNLSLREISVDGNGGDGIQIIPGGSGKLTMLVTNSSVNGNAGDGVNFIGGGSTGSITATLNVAAAGNAGIGITAGSGIGHTQPIVMVTGSKVVNNGSGGLRGNGNVQVFVDRTQISGNSGFGWDAFNGGVVKSYANNQVNGNADDSFNGVTQITSE